MSKMLFLIATTLLSLVLLFHSSVQTTDLHPVALSSGLVQKSPTEIFLVNTLDGNLHAVDMLSGKIIWSLGRNSRKQGSSENAKAALLFSENTDFVKGLKVEKRKKFVNSLNSEFLNKNPNRFRDEKSERKTFKKVRRVLAITTEDGTTFVSDSGSDNYQFKKIPFSMNQMIEKSPISYLNTLIIGSKKSKLFVVDSADGRILFSDNEKTNKAGSAKTKTGLFEPNDEVINRKVSELEKRRSTLKIVRMEYLLKFINFEDNEKNVIMKSTEFSVIDEKSKKPKQTKTKNKIVSQKNGRASFFNEEGTLVWSVVFGSPVIQALSVDYNRIRIDTMFCGFQDNIPFDLPEENHFYLSPSVSHRKGQLQPIKPLKFGPVTKKPETTKTETLLFSEEEWMEKTRKKDFKKTKYVVTGILILLLFLYLYHKRAIKKEKQRLNLFLSSRKKKLLVHKLKFDSDMSKVLGTGSQGTTVFEGNFDGRKVAVKRLLKEGYKKEAEREINHLLELDEHPNVLRYYAKDEDANFIYIVLEHCEINLAQAVLGSPSSNNKDKRENLIQLDEDSFMREGREGILTFVRGMFEGVDYLHSKMIVHRDLKPQNILVKSGHVAKVADMGLSKKMKLDQSSFNTNLSGSLGWQPREVLMENRQSFSVDVFSLGCILFYVLTRGRHPFGSDPIKRVSNIRKGESFIPDPPANEVASPVKENMLTFEAVHLIECMIDVDAEDRPKIGDSLTHPLFWNADKSLGFLCAVSNRFEKEPAGSEKRQLLESKAAAVVNGSWQSSIDHELIKNLGKYRKYDYKAIRDLLRVIRNKAFHYSELPNELKTKLGEFPTGYFEYFSSRFPKLVLYVYLVAALGCFSESAFGVYFGGCSAGYLHTLEKSTSSRDWYPVFRGPEFD